MRRSGRILGAALFVAMAVAVAPALRRAARSWRRRVAVQGHSMEPTLHAGDWLLVDPNAYANGRLRVGDIVVAADPRAAERAIVKRVVAVNLDGSLRLAGDHPAHSNEDEQLAAVPAATVKGRAWFRYWPAGRAGMLR